MKYIKENIHSIVISRISIVSVKVRISILNVVKEFKRSKEFIN